MIKSDEECKTAMKSGLFSIWLVCVIDFSDTNSFSIIPSKNKLVNKELIVIVQSRPNAFEARQANRDTWIKTGKN